MLMKFSVSNYMSFGYKENDSGQIQPDCFYMYAGKSEQFKNRIIKFDSRNVLKFASIYGANASGKTNLIRAIECGKNIVLNTMDNIDLRNKYNRSKNINQSRPTYFEYEFTISDRCFAYGFTVNLYNQRILSEWLYELKDSKEFTIFERLADANEYYFDETIFSELENAKEFHYYIKDVNRISTSLLLYELQRRNLEHSDFQLFTIIYEWFEKQLVVIYPDTRLGSSYFRFESGNDKLTDVLDYLDTGITGYHMQKINEAAFKEYFRDENLAEIFLKTPKRNGQRKRKGVLIHGGTLFEIEYGEDRVKNIVKLLFKHGTDESSYEYGEESDGTQRLIELMDVILNDDKDKVFIIDELDRSLHPQMTRKFVDTFLKFSINTKTQLIITTHESNLMDLTMLRRDEMWFVERENDHTTSLCPLEKYKIRYDTVVSKNYLAGRYGAVPVFKDFEYVWGRDDECNH